MPRMSMGTFHCMLLLILVTLKLLLCFSREGVDVNVKDLNGDTALLVAYSGGHIGPATLFLDDGNTPLIFASEKGHILVETFL